ncbi:DUF6538 domain-containing protein [Nitratireductor aquimarinus]|uniref:DUF6538 domain-containing protein n=1 Tax=Nitratireductor aquimarinus TaxID=889300 RepID=UPI003B5B5560
MKPVADTLHLMKRGDVWHYYRRVPKHLIPIIGRAFIKRSLGVTARADAKRLRTIEDLKVEAMFAAAEQGRLPVIHFSKTGSVSLAMLTEHIRKTVAALDERSVQQFCEEPPVDRDDLKERLENASAELSILTNPADPRRDEWISGMFQRIVGELGITELDTKTEDRLVNLVERALLELGHRRIARYEQRYDRPYFDSLFDPSRAPSVTLGELSDIFLAEKEREYKLNGVSQKRTDKIKAIVSVLQEIVGPNVPVHSIDDDAVQRVRGLVAEIPINKGKLLPGLAMSEAIERARERGIPVLSHGTQVVYLNTFRDLLKVAVRKKLLLANPASDIRPLMKDHVPAERKREPWTPSLIRGFFEGGFYRSCAPGVPPARSHKDQAWRFWLPLIMLFSGARPNEIAQLHVDDFKQTQNGTSYFECVDDGDRSLKTSASRRRVPVHPELIRIGLLQFVEQRRSKAKVNGPSLFFELKPNKYGNKASYAAKRLNEKFIPAEIALRERQTLYSLRHNVRDALRRIKAPNETLLAVTGWTPAGKAASDDYGDPGHPDHHIEWVAAIQYDGLDLSFLYLQEASG